MSPLIPNECIIKQQVKSAVLIPPHKHMKIVSENWAFGEGINKNLSQIWRWFVNVRVPRDQDGVINSGRPHLVCLPWKHSAEDAHGDCRNWTLSSGTRVSADELRPGISCTCLSMTYYKDEQWIPSPAPRSLLVIPAWPWRTSALARKKKKKIYGPEKEPLGEAHGL